MVPPTMVRRLVKRLATIGIALITLAPLTASWTADAQTMQFSQSSAVQRRAVEAVIWGMPAVNYQLMLEAMLKANGAENEILYWSRPSNWQNQTLTPNPDTIYLMPFFDTKSVGPIVLEIPPARGGSLVGTIDDAWQCALEDIGPAGADKGKGGKYLILPPGYAHPIPPGYITLRSQTYGGYALIRSSLKSRSSADIAAAVAYAKQIRLYPLSQAADPPQSSFIDAYGHLFDATIPYDTRFFQVLNRFVQHEPWLTRDKAMIDELSTLGIEKGKPFEPSTETGSLLDSAAHEANSEIQSLWMSGFSPPFYPGTRWALPVKQDLIVGLSNFFEQPNSYPVDDRAVYFFVAFFSAKHLGTGQYYLFAIADGSGRQLDGSRNYQLIVPPNPPVNLYWSVTAYNSDTNTLIRNMPSASCASNNTSVRKNADGSVVIYFGPTPPAGHETNWVPTRAGQHWWALFRAYGPQKSFFDKTWELPDIQPTT